MLKQQQNIVWRNVDDETLILNTANGYYFSLNQSGSEIWNWLVDGASVDETAQHLADRYGLSAETARGDVCDLLQTLKDEKITD